MPGYDGTGPKGRGPMTGGGRGYCVLKMPSAPDEAPSGFAGFSARPVTIGVVFGGNKLEALRAQAQRIRVAIRSIESRLAMLEAVGKGTSRRAGDEGPGENADGGVS
jgi:hypothetical protein